MGKAAYSQPDRDAFGLPALRLDAGKRPPPRGHRRLPAVDAGQLSFYDHRQNIKRRHSGIEFHSLSFRGSPNGSALSRGPIAGAGPNPEVGEFGFGRRLSSG